MKKFLFALLITSGLAAQSQVFNNEWIDYSKTYYKFKVGKTGLFRISHSVLLSAGLGATPAEQFQLWRNGAQVPIYTSVASGSFSSSDYIEFWGKMNDGKPDKELFRLPEYHLNDKWSLETDTASYFLTVNAVTAQNLRLENTANNVAGNSQPAEPYFMHTAGNYFKNQINKGYAVNVGEYLYSSSYDKGEGWTSSEINSSYSSGSPNFGKNVFVFKNLFAYPGGPDPVFEIAASGNAINTRRYYAQINSDSIISQNVDFFNYAHDSTTFRLASINGVSDTITVTNMTFCASTTCPTADRMVIHKYEITYPRSFNFDNQTNFEFNLPANFIGNYLEITNFNYGVTAPVLLDLTNGKRYVADISAAPLLKFALEASNTDRELVLVSQENSNLNSVTTLQTRNFINYTTAANQGDYLIITNPILFNGSNGTNPVEEYKTYRNSSAGGSYNAKVYLSDELIDQFGFGIKNNPAGLRNFIRYARLNYAVKPKQVFIIGRGVNYWHSISIENLVLNPASPDYASVLEQKTNLPKLNLVPTFGWPASDVLLTCEPGSSLPELSIGRISVITAAELVVYLKKIKEFEAAQNTSSPKIADKAWMKNVVHIVGASEAGLEGILTNYMNTYSNIVADTLYGARVERFSKSTSNAVENLSSTRLNNLFKEGISLITYFGHSSTTTLEFNLDNPENYENFGKYPLFLGLGCNAGDFFKYSPLRLQTKETLSEKYVLSPDRGTIGFVASTHFGIVHYLDIWASRAYAQFSSKNYGKTMGEIMKLTAADVFSFTTQEDFYARCNTEQSEFHGDPALRLNPHPKADYVIEEPMVKFSPGFVSIFEKELTIEAEILNIGKAPDTDIILEVKHQLPNGVINILIRDTVPGIRYRDSLKLFVPVLPAMKGLNKFTITVDADGAVDESFENNNVISKEIMIYEDEARPIYPYNFGIVNKQITKLIASTANPFAVSKQYQMEIDTTEKFNSPIKVNRTITSVGGILEFDPGIVLSDSTVYYWRVAPVVTSGDISWNGASFIYLPNSDQGFAQNHFFQHLRSVNGLGMALDTVSRKWKFGNKYYNVFIRQGSWVTSIGQNAGLSVAVNGGAFIRNTCWYQSVVFNVFSGTTFTPMRNITLDNSGAVGHALYGSASNNCSSGREYSFEYRWDSATSRKRAMDFMNNDIPDGSYVIVRSFLLDPVTHPAFANLIRYAADWQADEAIYGPGQTLYHSLKNAGFSAIDSFNRPRQFAFIYKKNDPSYTPKWILTDGTYDNVTLTSDCHVPDTIGHITSPKFGPSKQWKELKWDGSTDPIPGDNPGVDVLGIRPDGTIDTLIRRLNLSQRTIDISHIDAVQYPYLQLHMLNADTVNGTPYTLKYWRLTGVPAPEGAIAPNIMFQLKNNIEPGEPLDFKIAFKNISDLPFDSLKVKLVITDRNNQQHQIVFKQKPLPNQNDTVHIRYPIDTRIFGGTNLLYVEVNPDNDQPEQYHFNNFAYGSFKVKADTLNPLLDVTFDNVHILNHDIVSSRPNIVIKLKDESKFNPLDDKTVMTVQVRYPDGTLVPYNFNSDTLQFVPAQPGSNGDNTASAVFKPYFPEDGEYELLVSGKDMSGNSAGSQQYRVSFQVINKPMISNMLNYPNPFTTSTAFVFTLTGSEVPQNIKIQVLTVTGKVVREITKQELGPLHIGRNITEFKWDGTDQYGQKLGNGVYLYRVVTNLNGKSLDKYTSKDEATDKYFNKGYGKMYLMR